MSRQHFIAFAFTVCFLLVQSTAQAGNGLAETTKGTQQLGEKTSSTLQSSTSNVTIESSAKANNKQSIKNKFPPKAWRRADPPFQRKKPADAK